MIPLGDIIKNDLDSSVTNVEYLVRINTGVPIYIASRKQMLEIEEDGTKQYFEDFDLKIPSITERIDLRNKKIQLTSLNVTFTNFPVNNARLSDALGSAMGVDFEIFLKTQNCRTLEECVLIAVQKISRITHPERTPRWIVCKICRRNLLMRSTT